MGKRRSGETRWVTERGTPQLKFVGTTFSEETIRGIIDDCVVPALVRDFLRAKKMSENEKQKA